MKIRFLEFQKIFKILIFIVISLNFNINTYAQLIKEEINPSCKSISSEKDFKNLSIFKNIEINYNEAKLQKKIVVKHKELDTSQSNSLYLAGQLKKKSNWSTTKVKFADKICTFNSKVRMTGDLSDHIDFKSNYKKAYTSFLLLINDEAIMNNSEYKFFLPISRNFENEVFVANLFSELGFLSPRTAIFEISLNGEKKKFIIQENINKNFLEFNKLKEGLIIEGSEILGLDNPISLANVKNRSWAIRNDDNLRISIKALSYLNQIYYSHSINTLNVSDPYVETQLFKDKNKKILEEFDALLHAVKAHHANSRNDRKFYFDSIVGNFYPIYYDGMSTILDNPKITLSETEGLPISAKKGLLRIEKKISDINVYSFNERLKNNGLHLTISKVNNILDEIKYNINILKKVKNNPTLKNYQLRKENLNFLDNNVNKLVLSNYNNNKIFFCDPKSFNCNEKKLRQSHIKLIFPDQNYYNPQKKTQLYLGDFENEFDFFSNYKNKISFMDNSSELKVDNTSIYYSENIEVKINKKNKVIKIINKKNYENRILFYGGSLSNWTIESASLDTENYLKKGKISYYSLTGCLNFYKVNLKDINLKIKNSYCEDAVNLVYSSGSLKYVEISDSEFDAIDLDFSNIEINKIIINRAKNDCIDYSGGNYIIKVAHLNGCFDKGLSIGEKSNLNADEINITDSKIGIAVKDSSKTKINKYFSNNVTKCAMVYRKKKEYIGGQLSIENNNCDIKKYFVQKNSKLELR
tara:strand:- start:1746 stop:4001 length:2256 start_codon:yes stop_codon:yes gene_type:complete